MHPETDWFSTHLRRCLQMRTSPDLRSNRLWSICSLNKSLNPIPPPMPSPTRQPATHDQESMERVAGSSRPNRRDIGVSGAVDTGRGAPERRRRAAASASGDEATLKHHPKRTKNCNPPTHHFQLDCSGIHQKLPLACRLESPDHLVRSRGA